MESKKPKNWYFPFVPKDWLSDAKLRMCSFQTKGAWIDLICLMNQSDGFLVIDGVPLDVDGIQQILGLKSQPDVFGQIWSELTTHGVIKITANGTWHSKRMVKDYKKYE